MSNASVGDDVAVAARPAYIGRQRALEILGVKPQTLYSYVSRGLVRRRAERGGRPSFYNVQDIQRLKARSLARSGHGPAAASAIHWGEPVLGTAITEITERGPLYRKHLAVDLARSNHRFETVAEYLWTGAAIAEEVSWHGQSHKRVGRQLGDIAASGPSIHIRQLMSEAVLLLGIACSSEERQDVPDWPMQQARELMRAMIGTFGFLGSARRYLPPRRGDSVAQALVRALGLGQSPEVRQALDRLLVIVADHEFTPATFAARIAASTGNDLYSCIGAALQVHFGAAMGLRCDRIEESLHHTDAGRERGAAIVSRSRELEHPLYREGDPRAVALMDIVEQLVSAGAAPGFARAAIPPRGATVVDLDYALVAVCRALGAVPQAAGGLLAFGRTAGWIAHVFEQRGEDFVIRPRARFIPRPPCVGRA